MRSFEHRFQVEDPENVEVTRYFFDREVFLRVEDVTLQFDSFYQFRTFISVLVEKTKEFEAKQLEKLNGS